MREPGESGALLIQAVPHETQGVGAAVVVAEVMEVVDGFLEAWDRLLNYDFIILLSDGWMVVMPLADEKVCKLHHLRFRVVRKHSANLANSSLHMSRLTSM